jgi:hypothetical protein
VCSQALTLVVRTDEQAAGWGPSRRDGGEAGVLLRLAVGQSLPSIRWWRTKAERQVLSRPSAAGALSRPCPGRATSSRRPYADHLPQSGSIPMGEAGSIPMSVKVITVAQKNRASKIVEEGGHPSAGLQQPAAARALRCLRPPHNPFGTRLSPMSYCDRFRPHRYLSGAGKQIGFASQGS